MAISGGGRLVDDGAALEGGTRLDAAEELETMGRELDWARELAAAVEDAPDADDDALTALPGAAEEALGADDGGRRELPVATLLADAPALLPGAREDDAGSDPPDDAGRLPGAEEDVPEPEAVREVAAPLEERGPEP